MELWQKIVKIHDIVGTKPIDIACCISQQRVQHHKGHFQWWGGGGGQGYPIFLYTLLFPAVLGYPRIVTASLINVMIL